jgi:hypothetical protein
VHVDTLLKMSAERRVEVGTDFSTDAAMKLVPTSRHAVPEMCELSLKMSVDRRVKVGTDFRAEKRQ